MSSKMDHIFQSLLIICLINYSINELIDSLTIECDVKPSVVSTSSCPTNSYCDVSKSLCVCDQFYVSYVNKICLPRKAMDEMCFTDAQCIDQNGRCDRDSDDTSLWLQVKYKEQIKQINESISSEQMRSESYFPLKVGYCKCGVDFVYNYAQKRCVKSVTDNGNDYIKPIEMPNSRESFYNILNKLSNRSDDRTSNVIISSSDANGSRNPINKIILIFSLMFVFAIVAEIIVKLLSKTYYNNQRHLITNTYWSYPSSSDSTSSSTHNNNNTNNNNSGGFNANNVNSNDIYANTTVPSVSLRFSRAPPSYHQLPPLRTQETVLLLDETDGISQQDKPPSYEEAIRETVAATRSQPNESQL